MDKKRTDIQEDRLISQHRPPGQNGSFPGSYVTDAAPGVTYTYRAEWYKTDDTVEWRAEIRLDNFRKEHEASGTLLLKRRKEFVDWIREEIERQIDNMLKLRKMLRGRASRPRKKGSRLALTKRGG